ncbi:MAG: type II toxin-antitoxin system RelE/ParE family toxin [Gammaproteobacteria bacterium]|nr:type II toxin-antitoxin system RelE/ParE family toxin [Gammaproteobacteria bacterium]
MEIKWLKQALQNLDQEAEYIAKENPQAASDIVSKIINTVRLLENNPALGSPGRIINTRELLISNTRYVVPYRVRPDRQQIEILRIFHTARRPPKQW